MTATALAALTAGGALPGDAAAALAIAVGAVCLVGWLARLGFLANLLSHPILTGYMAGIAVLMIISQLDNFTGIPIPSGEHLHRNRISACDIWIRFTFSPLVWPSWCSRC